MTQASRHDGPRYLTLRDYLLVLRARWLVIVLVAIVFSGGALALALRQPKTYQGRASVEFVDPTANEAEILGLPANVTFSPQAQAAEGQASLTQPQVQSQAKKLLHLAPKGAALPGSITSYINPTTNYLIVQATARQAPKAAAIANAYANGLVAVNTQSMRAKFRQLAAVANRELRTLPANDQITRSVYEDRAVRLTYFAQAAISARVITPAATPGSPASPHPVRDALLGLLVGITLGLLLAFVIDSLDRRLRRGTEITDELGWPILGHIREAALGGVAFQRNGQSGAGNDRPTIEHLDWEAFHILRRNLQLINLDDNPRSIVVTSAMPEEGKSTVAASLACALASAGKLTVLIECDLRRPALADRLGLDPEPGLVDFLLGDASPSDVVQTMQLPGLNRNGASPNGGAAPKATAEGAIPKLACITSGKRCSQPAELLASERFHAFLAEIKQAYEMVVLDSAPVLAVADPLELVTDSDATLVCLRATRTTRDEANALKLQLTRVPDNQVGLVITGVPFGAGREFGYYSYAYGYE